jgi:hypothetical protein
MLPPDQGPNRYGIITSNENTTLWVELKAPGKKPKPHQVREHDRMRRMGQMVVVIDSMDGVEALLS